MFRSTLEEHDQIDPAETLMREVGAQLREVRLERGEELDQVAENLRIKPAYLEGIERGDLSIMPGRTYALGFLRSYAEYLGFDGDDLIRQIKSTVENLTDHARLHIRTPLPESRLPKTSLVVLSLALVGGVYAGWMYLSDQQQRLDVETVAEVPDDLQRPALDSLPSALSAEEPEGRVTAPATAGDRTVPAEPAAPLDEPVDTSALESPQGVEPEIQAGGGEEAQPADRAGLPRAPRPSRTTEAAAAEMPTAEPSAVDASETSTGSGTAGRPANATDLGLAPATDALDRIIEAERAGSAEAAGDGRSVPDTPAERSDGAAGDEAGFPRADEAGIAPDAGPAEAGSTTDDMALRSKPAQAGSSVDAGAPAEDAAGAGQGARGTTEDVLAALGPTDSGSEGTPRVYERDNTDARVVIRARERSWIRITSESGDYLRTRTLEEGDVFLVPDRADLTLWTGNAGGLEVIVDGETLPPLGADGTVRKDVPLDPESLFARAAQRGKP